jgi:A/G-specific adenine glycosylase
MKVPLNHQALSAWFLENQRDLPWRQSPTPYEVWVSEVMLQQTQVAVVIPYFQRWMELFPSIEALAEAEPDVVIKAWEGLGYYSRARNLHAGAKYVSEHYDGKLPEDEKGLSAIKGLGPYTIGAIQSFAFKRKAAAVDGNVLRVIARYLMLKDDISKPATVRAIREWILDQLPEEAPWVVNEALIELGATVCGRKPNCRSCPLQSQCLSFRHGYADKLPNKGNRTLYIPLYRAVAVIHCKEHFLVRKGEKGEIMRDLHEFPYFETGAEGWTPQETKQAIETGFGLEVLKQDSAPPVKQTFTKYRVSLSPQTVSVGEVKQLEGYSWYHLNDLKKLAFSSGHRKIFDYIRKV